MGEAMESPTPLPPRREQGESTQKAPSPPHLTIQSVQVEKTFLTNILSAAIRQALQSHAGLSKHGCYGTRRPDRDFYGR